jgi:hypothetical protein
LEPLTALPDVRRIADLHRATVNRSHKIQRPNSRLGSRPIRAYPLR